MCYCIGMKTANNNQSEITIQGLTFIVEPERTTYQKGLCGGPGFTFWPATLISGGVPHSFRIQQRDGQDGLVANTQGLCERLERKVKSIIWSSELAFQELLFG